RGILRFQDDMDPALEVEAVARRRRVKDDGGRGDGDEDPEEPPPHSPSHQATPFPFKASKESSSRPRRDKREAHEKGPRLPGGRRTFLTGGGASQGPALS